MAQEERTALDSLVDDKQTQIDAEKAALVPSQETALASLNAKEAEGTEVLTSEIATLNSTIESALCLVTAMYTGANEIEMVNGDSSALEAEIKTLEEKETLEWIDSIGKGETLWDIGANVGLYSLYAAQSGVHVLAFEPSPANYHLLNSNIEKNCLHHSISAYCLAFSEKTELGSFYMSSTEAGSALNSFGEAVDWQGKPFDPAMRQGMIAFAIDDFIKQFDPALPNHLKIDVDGIEPLILRGASSLLSEDSLLSLQVELDYGNEKHAYTVIEHLKKFGFETVSKSHAEMFENTEFSNVYNVLFKRNRSCISVIPLVQLVCIALVLDIFDR